MAQAALHKHLRYSFHFHVEDSFQQWPFVTSGNHFNSWICVLVTMLDFLSHQLTDPIVSSLN